MTPAEMRDTADKLRHYGLEALKFAAELDVAARATDPNRLPTYKPSFEVIDGVELITERLACCGSGTDQRDPRTGERLHLLGCPEIARSGLAACRRALGADYTEDDDSRAQFENIVDAGGLG